MKTIEYETIRNEMMQRFRWAFEVIFFSIISTSAIISWLAVNRSQGLNSPGSPYLFIMIGLGIVAYLFWFYHKALEGIYNQGSYLAVFHELENNELNWHILSRFQNEIRGKSSKWGSDGRKAAGLLVLLAIVNIVAPLAFLHEKIIPNSYLEGFIDLIIIIAIICLIIKITSIYQFLMKTKENMHKSMKKWFKVKEELSKKKILTDNKKLEEKIKKDFLKMKN